MIQDLNTIQEYEHILAESQIRPVLLLKHSTRCPISASAWREFQSLAEREKRAAFYRILVVENRPLSLHIADSTGIRHESPQVFLFRHGHVSWHASHWAITAQSMAGALDTTL